MLIIEIKANEYGGHDNQTTDAAINIPDGWALVPNNMELENFPFGEVTARKINGVKTVTKWVAGTIPESTEETEETPENTGSNIVTWDELDKAYTEGVNGAYEQ